MAGYERPSRVVERGDDGRADDLLSELLLDAYTNHTWLQVCGLKLYHRAHDGRNVLEVYPPEDGRGERLEIVNCSAFKTVSALRETLESIRSEHIDND